MAFESFREDLARIDGAVTVPGGDGPGAVAALSRRRESVSYAFRIIP